MKYEFHVGDYVELKDGRHGYITEILCSTFQFHLIGLNPKLIIMQYPLYDSYCLYSNNFNRIGQYDFTKPEVKKIEHFEYNYPGSEIRLTAKINELVDAVNELRKERT